MLMLVCPLSKPENVIDENITGEIAYKKCKHCLVDIEMSCNSHKVNIATMTADCQ